MYGCLYVCLSVCECIMSVYAYNEYQLCSIYMKVSGKLCVQLGAQ